MRDLLYPNTGRIIAGTICAPIRHEDESEAKNVQRLVTRFAGLTAQIQTIDEEIWSLVLRTAYYPPRTRQRRECADDLRGCLTKVRDLNRQRIAVRQLLTKRGGSLVVRFLAAESICGRGTWFNSYQTSWLSRLLRLAGDRAVIAIDDMRVALPELALRGDSASRMIGFLGA